MYYTSILEYHFNILWFVYMYLYFVYTYFLVFSLLEFTEMCVEWYINEEDSFWQIALRSNWTNVCKGLSAVPDK